MSYYTMALEFWTAASLALIAPSVVAATARNIAKTLARALHHDVAVHSTRTGPASC